MDVWTVVDFTWQEGGNVLGVADSVEGAKRIAERDYEHDHEHDFERVKLAWVEHRDGRHEADQGDAPQSYIVQRWTVESSLEPSPGVTVPMAKEHLFWEPSGHTCTEERS